MDIRNAKDALKWLASWEWRPRKAILDMAIEGQKTCLHITEAQGKQNSDEAWGYRQAILILDEHKKHLAKISGAHQ